MVSRSTLLRFAVACALASCTSSPTQVIVAIDSDLQTPLELDALNVVVTSPTGETQTGGGTLLDGDPPLPRTLGLSHTTGALGPFEVRVEGLLGGVVQVSRSARFDFQSGQILVLTMHLARRCVSVDCGPDATCTERGCEPVLTADLPPWTGNPPRLVDGGMMDAAVDAAVDAEVDAGVDAEMDACVPSGMELCNRIDDDCDGSVDEGFEAMELCNRVDDDCDGSIDEGFGDVDACNTVDDDCDGIVDEGVAEFCNMDDDDCDGTVDEGLSGVVEICDMLDQDCDGTVDENLAAVVEVCDELDQDCDGTVDEGFDLQTDATHCGECGNVCTFMNGAGSCVTGTCVLESCDVGFADCDGNVSNGCEVNTNVSTTNCGTCTNECRPPLRMCCLGTCAREC